MANFVILTAGGTGTRMHFDLPKQFITVNDKSIIAFTMEAFQASPQIDGIVVSCLDGWEKVLGAYAKTSHITKLIDIVQGGETGQQSIFNALDRLKTVAKDDDLVLIHDGNRPLVSGSIIDDSIRVASKYGDAVAHIPSVEIMALVDNDEANENCASKSDPCKSDSSKNGGCDVPTASRTIERQNIMRTQTPHTFKYADILQLHTWAREQKIETAAAPELLKLKGRKIHLSLGDEKNFKITTASDLEIFKALIKYGVEQS